MIKHIFKPFWSYDIISTEKWLSKMAASGFILKSIHFKSRIFVFIKEQPQILTYCIIYNKGNNKLNETLENCGWSIVDKSKHWCLIQNCNNEINLFPRRDKIIAKNKRLSFITIILLGIFSAYDFFGIVIITLTFTFMSNSGAPVKYVPAPYPILDLVPYFMAILDILILFWLIFTFVKTRIGLKKLSVESGYNVSPSVLGNSIKNQYIKKDIEASKCVKIRKLFWFYDIDETFEWLEQKTGEGLVLRYIKSGITFMFEKATPRKIKYFIDTNPNLTQDYYDIHIQSGYILLHDSTALYGRIIIWCKEYCDGEPEPNMYSDNVERLDCAKRLLKNNLKFIIIWLVLGTIQIFVVINIICYFKTLNAISVFDLLIWAFLVITYFIALYKSIRGYQKLKNKIRNS